MRPAPTVLLALFAAAVPASAQDVTFSGPAFARIGPFFGLPVATATLDAATVLPDGVRHAVTAAADQGHATIALAVTKHGGSRIVLTAQTDFETDFFACEALTHPAHTATPLLAHVPAGSRWALTLAASHTKTQGQAWCLLDAGAWQVTPPPIQPHFYSQWIAPSVTTRTATTILEGGRSYALLFDFDVHGGDAPGIDKAHGIATFTFDRVAEVGHGTGCAGTWSTVPELIVSGDFTPGSTASLHLVNGAPAGQAFLAIAAQPGNVPAGFGCSLLVDSAALALVGPIPLQTQIDPTPGTASFDATLNAGPGATGAIQGFVVPPFGGGFSATNAVTITIQ